MQSETNALAQSVSERSPDYEPIVKAPRVTRDNEGFQEAKDSRPAEVPAFNREREARFRDQAQGHIVIIVLLFFCALGQGWAEGTTSNIADETWPQHLGLARAPSKWQRWFSVSSGPSLISLQPFTYRCLHIPTRFFGGVVSSSYYSASTWLVHLRPLSLIGGKRSWHLVWLLV